MTRSRHFSFDSFNHENLKEIGTGAYGTVYRAEMRGINGEDGCVALKKVRIQLNDEGIPMSTLREIAMLKQLDQYEHPNIIRLLDICQGQRNGKQLTLYLVFEHVDQDLSTYIKNCPPPGISPPIIKHLMHQIVCGIDFLHSHRILHRDLKPQNLLITNSRNIKLADFGLAKTYDFEMRLTTTVVTLWYRSPEVLLGGPYATPVDIWSIGCIMAEMYNRRPLFCGVSEGDQLAKIFQVIGTPKTEDWPEDVSVHRGTFSCSRPVDLRTLVPEICELGNDLLQRMLRFKVKDRISAAEALNHAYFHDSTYVVPVVGCDMSINNENRTLSDV